MTTTLERRAGAAQSGFVLLAVLLLAVLMVSMTMGYARHALMAADGSSANMRSQAAEQAAGSGFAWAKQSLLADGARSASFRIGDGSGVAVSVADTGSDKRAITVAASGPGTSQQVAATAETFATTNGTLPSLTAAAKSAVSAAAASSGGSGGSGGSGSGSGSGSSALTSVTGSTTYHDTELSGVLYLRYGSSLTLRNVILTGAIVSEAAVTGSWTPAQATTITLDKGVLIEPGSLLPGCSIVAPDAILAGSGAERVQIQGIIITAQLSLPGTGALHAQVATGRTPVISSAIDMPGSGRAPRGWPACLDTGAEGLSRVVFLRSDPTRGERDAIETFQFPARDGSHVQAAPASGGG